MRQSKNLAKIVATKAFNGKKDGESETFYPPCNILDMRNVRHNEHRARDKTDNLLWSSTVPVCVQM